MDRDCGRQTASYTQEPADFELGSISIMTRMLRFQVRKINIP